MSGEGRHPANPPVRNRGPGPGPSGLMPRWVCGHLSGVPAPRLLSPRPPVAPWGPSLGARPDTRTALGHRPGAAGQWGPRCTPLCPPAPCAVGAPGPGRASPPLAQGQLHGRPSRSLLSPQCVCTTASPKKGSTTSSSICKCSGRDCGGVWGRPCPWRAVPGARPASLAFPFA